MEAQIRSLQSLGEDIDNNYLVSLIKSKLPESFNLRLEEIRDEKWTMQLLRKSINKLISAREKSEGVVSESNDVNAMEFTTVKR